MMLSLQNPLQSELRGHVWWRGLKIPFLADRRYPEHRTPSSPVPRLQPWTCTAGKPQTENYLAAYKKKVKHFDVCPMSNLYPICTFSFNYYLEAAALWSSVQPPSVCLFSVSRNRNHLHRAFGGHIRPDTPSAYHATEVRYLNSTAPNGIQGTH